MVNSTSEPEDKKIACPYHPAERMSLHVHRDPEDRWRSWYPKCDQCEVDASDHAAGDCDPQCRHCANDDGRTIPGLKTHHDRL